MGTVYYIVIKVFSYKKNAEEKLILNKLTKATFVFLDFC